MTRLAVVPDSPSLKEGERAIREIEGTSVLLLRDKGVVHAVENRCPHRGAPLSGALLRDGCLNCPWHGLRFHIESGECTTDAKMRLRTFRVDSSDEQFSIELPESEPKSKVAADVRTALVRYGGTGQVGWFGTIHPMPLHRGAQVIVESAIGQQLGEVLLGEEGSRNSEPQQIDLCGELVRDANSEDFGAHAKAAEFAKQHFAAIDADLKVLNHTAVEIEATLDQQTIVVWLLTPPDASLGPLAVELASRLGVNQVRFLERTSDEASLSTSSRYNISRPSKDASKEEQPMRGPGLRQKHDFDRVWECPVCHHRERTSGMQTTANCPKCVKTEANPRPPYMKLVSSPATAPRRTFEVVSNTPVPVPVVTLLGEDTVRIPRKQALRAASIAANDAKEKAALEQAEANSESTTSPEAVEPPQTESQESPPIETNSDQS